MSLTQTQKRYPSQESSFGVTIKPQTLRETDQLREDLPRSHYVERALRYYNACVKKARAGNASVTSFPSVNS